MCVQGGRKAEKMNRIEKNVDYTSGGYFYVQAQCYYAAAPQEARDDYVINIWTICVAATSRPGSDEMVNGAARLSIRHSGLDSHLGQGGQAPPNSLTCLGI